MGSTQEEKDWELRRLVSKYIHGILTDTGNPQDAKIVAAQVLNILCNPVPFPHVEGVAKASAEIIRLVVST